MHAPVPRLSSLTLWRVNTHWLLLHWLCVVISNSDHVALVLIAGTSCNLSRAGHCWLTVNLCFPILTTAVQRQVGHLKHCIPFSVPCCPISPSKCSHRPSCSLRPNIPLRVFTVMFRPLPCGDYSACRDWLHLPAQRVGAEERSVCPVCPQPTALVRGPAAHRGPVHPDDPISV